MSWKILLTANIFGIVQLTPPFQMFLFCFVFKAISKKKIGSLNNDQPPLKNDHFFPVPRVVVIQRFDCIDDDDNDE